MPKKAGAKKASPAQKGLKLETFILKIKDTFPEKDLVLKKDARDAIHKIIVCLVDNYVKAVVTLAEHSRKHTVSAREVQSATRILLKGELSKHAVSEGTKAVTKYLSFSPKKDKRGFTVPVSGAEKAGLRMSPARLDSYLRQQIPDYKVDTRVTETAPVYLAAVLEYVIVELMDISSKKAVADASKKRQVTSECLLDAIRGDPEMLGTLCSCL